MSEVAVKNTSRVIRHGQVASGFSVCLVAVALTLGVLPAQAASATNPPPSVTLVCASRVSSGHYARVLVSGKVTNLRPKTSFGIAVHQPPSFKVTHQDPVFTTNASGVLTITPVTINAATDNKNKPYTKGPASFNALYTGLIGVQGGGPGLVADLNVTIPPTCR